MKAQALEKEDGDSISVQPASAPNCRGGLAHCRGTSNTDVVVDVRRH